MREIKYEDWIKEGEKLFGKDKKKWKFVCPSCGGIQTIQDFIDLKVEEPENYVHFSCIGRFTDGCKGEIGNKRSPCNYTNGGLFNFAKLKVLRDGEKSISVFEFAIQEGEQ